MWIWVGAVLAGAMIGSFLNVVIHRLPLMINPPDGAGRLSLAWPPSHCPRCAAPIRGRHNIPLLGWAMLRGRCADCGGRISVRYPLVEAAGAALAALALWRFGPCGQAVLATALLWALLCVAVTDLEHLLIPDALSLSILWTGLTASALGLWPETATDAVLGAGLGYAGLRLIEAAATRLAGREAMGGGDAKLMAALGAWVGWREVPMVFLGACVVGTIVALPLIVSGRHHRQAPFPFGPFLAVAGAVTVFFPHLAAFLYK